MRSLDKLAALANQVAHGTDCRDQLEFTIVECAALHAGYWLHNTLGLSGSESLNVVRAAMQEDWSGNLPDRILRLATAGWNGLLAVADLFAPDLPEVL